jgi:hypothetical protein
MWRLLDNLAYLSLGIVAGVIPFIPEIIERMQCK